MTEFKSGYDEAKAEHQENAENSEVSQLQARIAELEDRQALTDLYLDTPDSRPEALSHFLGQAKEAGIKGSDSAAAKALIQNLQSSQTYGNIFSKKTPQGKGEPLSEHKARLIHPDDLKYLEVARIATPEAIRNGTVKVSPDAERYEPRKIY